MWHALFWVLIPVMGAAPLYGIDFLSIHFECNISPDGCGDVVRGTLFPSYHTGTMTLIIRHAITDRFRHARPPESYPPSIALWSPTLYLKY